MNTEAALELIRTYIRDVAGVADHLVLWNDEGQPYYATDTIQLILVSSVRETDPVVDETTVTTKQGDVLVRTASWIVRFVVTARIETTTESEKTTADSLVSGLFEPSRRNSLRDSGIVLVKVADGIASNFRVDGRLASVLQYDCTFRASISVVRSEPSLGAVETVEMPATITIPDVGNVTFTIEATT